MMVVTCVGAFGPPAYRLHTWTSMLHSRPTAVLSSITLNVAG